MCDLPKTSETAAEGPHFGRRSVLAGVGAAVGAAAIGVTHPLDAHATAPVRPKNCRPSRTRLVLLGTGGGPGVPEGDRYGISTAVCYGDRVYIVDLGWGAPIRLLQAGLGLSSSSSVAPSLRRVRGVFFTHLHSDHTAEWPALYSTPQNLFGATTPITVFGPGDRHTLPEVLPPNRPTPRVISPADPTPGIQRLTGYLERAFASDLNDRSRAGATNPPSTLFDIKEIDVSPYWTVDPAGVPPRIHPFPVWQDGDVRVTTTLVDHRPTAPAFAFRFDTPDGSIVVSGDTRPSDNLIELAHGADYLAHEVIDPEWVDRAVAGLPPAQQGAVRSFLLSAHTTIDQVGAVAEKAQVKNLVLTHLVPATNPASRWRAAGEVFSGRLIIGEDLMELNVGRRTR